MGSLRVMLLFYELFIKLALQLSLPVVAVNVIIKPQILYFLLNSAKQEETILVGANSLYSLYTSVQLEEETIFCNVSNTILESHARMVAQLEGDASASWSIRVAVIN